jgi:hypothetical protein
MKIDHINGDCSDNRWKNLLEATSTENKRNSRIKKTNILWFKLSTSEPTKPHRSHI